MPSDAELLEQYTRHRTEAAFAELVRRHTDFVYATAVRVAAGDSALAEDATQEVFIKLAARTSQLAGYESIIGWLHTTARHVTINLIRGDQRRRTRHQTASAMQTINAAPAVNWEELRPVLDEAVEKLPDDERQAVLLRFFKNHSHKEVGAQLGLSEDSARKRVERALEKLHGYFSARGMTTTSAMLGTIISAHSEQVAPAGLASRIIPVALAGAGTVGTGGAYFLTLMSLKTKIAAVVAVCAALTVSIGFILHSSAQSSKAMPVRSSANQFPALTANAAADKSSQVVPPSQPSVAVTSPVAFASTTTIAPPLAAAPPVTSQPARSISPPKPASTIKPVPNRMAKDMPQDVILAFQTAGYKLLQNPDIIAAVVVKENNFLHLFQASSNVYKQNPAIRALEAKYPILGRHFSGFTTIPYYMDPGTADYFTPPNFGSNSPPKKQPPLKPLMPACFRMPNSKRPSKPPKKVMTPLGEYSGRNWPPIQPLQPCSRTTPTFSIMCQENFWRSSADLSWDQKSPFNRFRRSWQPCLLKG